MNAFNPLASMKRLEEAGLARAHAEAIASEIGDGMSNLVTKDELAAALDCQTIKLGVIMSAIVALACTILGVVLSR